MLLLFLRYERGGHGSQGRHLEPHNKHGKAVLDVFYGSLTEKEQTTIEVVACDGTRGAFSFSRQVRQKCPDSPDHFSVKAYLNVTLEDVRKQELAKAKEVVQSALRVWIGKALRSGLTHFKELALKLFRKRHSILNLLHNGSPRLPLAGLPIKSNG